MREQVQLGKDIQSWLVRNYPGLEDHPAAISMMLRLRYLHGPGVVTKKEHGQEILAAVAAWEQRRSA